MWRVESGVLMESRWSREWRVECFRRVFCVSCRVTRLSYVPCVCIRVRGSLIFFGSKGFGFKNLGVKVYI